MSHTLKPLPSFEYLHECLSYDEHSGMLTRKVRPISHFNTEKSWKCANRYAGKLVDAIFTNKSGKSYYICTIDGEIIMRTESSIRCYITKNLRKLITTMVTVSTTRNTTWALLIRLIILGIIVFLHAIQAV